MVASIRIDVTGAAPIERQLAGLADAFGDLTDLMEGFGLTLESSVTDRFDSESAPDGSKWTPSIRAKQDGGKTLSDTARLRQSVHSVAGAKQVEVGTNLIYAGVHQFGATIRAKSSKGLRFQLPGGLGWRRIMAVEIPARPFLGLSSDDIEELLAQTEDYALAAGGAA